MWRKATAACLVLAPVALAVATGVDPALGEDQGYGVYRQHPDATLWHAVLLHWAWVMLAVGFIGLLLRIRGRGSVPAAIGWVATLLGLVTFSGLMAFDIGLLALEQQPTLTDAQLAAYDDQIGSYAWAQWGWQVPGILGWALALIVVPLAAAWARVISWWAAGLALAGTALYLLFAISPVPLCLTGPVVLIVAYTLAARQSLAPSETALPDGPALAPSEAALPGGPALAPSEAAFPRRAGLVCLVAAPLSFAIGMATVPPGSGDSSTYANHPGLAQASAFFLHLAWVLFVPAVTAVAERGGRFTRAAGFVTVLALINFSALMLGDYTDLAARQALGDPVADRAMALTDGYALFTLGWAMPGMVLSLLGLIAVAIGAARDGLVRWWVPALVAAGFAGFFMLPFGPLGVLGPAVLVVGFGLLGAALRRTPTAEPVLT
ncbi:hypothetical protein [Paractinoplanes atraurantiacus]|uniref:Uncharacterized protein n=1 Tax=Paractinoplanes atraurantiacus TaxID=1036182 RepID=A0A285EYP1_9ACTN|nr:hypothetical protein [Actinoplanes atraurantiacus]SNY03913.1 hypothetical protein SAMN05421748_10172 [Actinoplanes atraurantiacus]